MGINEGDLPLQCVYRWERERADRVFLTQPLRGGVVRDWSWAKAVGEVRRMAAYLKAQDWEPGSRVAILSKNCAWWIMADLAIWMAGHVSVPIYPSLRAQSIRQILEHSDSKACFLGATDDKEIGGLCALPGIVWIAFPTASVCNEHSWQAIIDSSPPMAGHVTRFADDLATIIYTSGTTGSPKGVMHRFAGLAYNARILIDRLRLTGEQRVLSYLPLAHIVERAGLEATGYIVGSHLFFTESIETFLTDLQRARPTIFLSVPRLLLKFQQGVFVKVPRQKLDRLLRIPAVNLYVKRRILRQLGLNTVHHAACGAAPLPPEILRWYRNLGLELAEGYGLSETMITHLPIPGTVRPGYVGQPLEGVETKVTAEGELLIRSAMNMLGYYKDPQGTRDAFDDKGYFRTGDVVGVGPDGQIKIIGRIKEQFKTSKGKYVAPAPIEGRLMEHPAVEACCLMGAGQPSPFAIVVLAEAVREQCIDPDARAGVEESLLARMHDVNDELDPFARVSRVFVADGPWTIANGLMTPTLKLKRSLIESRYQCLMGNPETQNPPVVWESIPTPRAAYAPAEIAILHNDVSASSPGAAATAEAPERDGVRGEVLRPQG